MLTRIALIIGLICGCACAQPLIKSIPADAMIYAGWAGTTDLPGYEQSHLKAVLDASDAPKLFTQFLPAVMSHISSRDQGTAEKFQLVSTLITPFWRHPSAIYVTGFERLPGDRVQVRATLLCDAGNDAPALVEKIQGLLKRFPPLPPEYSVQVSSQNGLVSITIGPPDTASGTLSDLPAFKNAFANESGGEAAAVYVDCDAIRKSIDAMVQSGHLRPDQVELFTKIEAASGLADAHQFSFGARFDHGNWVTQAFLAAPEVRTGLLAALANGLMSDDTLKLIPQSATLATACKFSLAQFYDQMRTTAGNVGPQYQQNFDSGAAAASGMLGVNVKTDLIDSFGDGWVMYVSPRVAGSGILGFVVENQLADPVKASNAMESIERMLNGLMAGRMHAPDTNIAFRQTQYNGLTIHYLAIPAISPAWAIDGNRLYVALYPQVIAGAQALAHSHEGSILDNPQFAQLRKSLGERFSAVHFLNAPESVEGVYTSWLFISHYLGFADLFGIPSPPMLLPPLPAIKAQLTPSMCVAWWDNAGWHERSASAFPGADVIAGDPTSFVSVGTSAMLASVLLPAMNRSRETANRVKCGSNMRQIGQAMLLYSNEHGGKFPSDMGTLIIAEAIPPQAFFCPSSNDSLSPEFGKMVPEAQAAWLDQHSDYIYLGKGKTSSSPPDVILLYEKDSDHHDGMNMLFGDGHVEFVAPLSQAHAMIDRQKKAGAK
ncbi:MAG TPA: H-X9-DG-CTERM domain-containing protein [Tepidisphaeraceae bacterium]|nr:H-X9-DG-CTERM domain-containing protein [Tepidisphaeraceae bacterium]